MLHHYNYSTSLSHFLSYHRLEEPGSAAAQEGQEAIDQSATTIASDDLSQQPPDEDTITEDTLSKKLTESLHGTANTAANKSFTIAAILGLKSDHHHHHHHGNGHNSFHGHGHGGHFGYLGQGHNQEVVNLSVHHNHHNQQQQLPVRHHHHHHGGSSGVTEHFAAAVTQGCAAKQTVRGLKHLTSGALQSKKNCKSKRVRTIFTPEQLERLEAEFERQQYMVGPERLYLAHTLQLTEAQVKVWFQNRRIKWRKHHLELTHQRLAVLKQQQMLLEHPDIQDTNSSSTDT